MVIKNLFAKVPIFIDFTTIKVKKKLCYKT